MSLLKYLDQILKRIYTISLKKQENIFNLYVLCFIIPIYTSIFEKYSPILYPSKKKRKEKEDIYEYIYRYMTIFFFLM